MAAPMPSGSSLPDQAQAPLSLPLTAPTNPSDDNDGNESEELEYLDIPGLIRVFKEMTMGIVRHPRPEWAKYRLPVEEYHELKQCIDDSDVWGYFMDKVRFDYSSNDEELILRMFPNALHELLRHNLDRRIQAKLDELKAKHPTELGPVLEKVCCEYRSNIFWTTDSNTDEDNPDQKSPDSQFRHLEGHWPSIVIEISYGQKLLDVPNIAHDYIYNTGGNIRTVLGFDLDSSPLTRRQFRVIKKGKETHPSKKARAAVWRAVEVTDKDSRGKEETYQLIKRVKNEAFRSETGQHLPGILTLPLTDFVSQVILELDTFPQATRTLIEATTIEIPYECLCADLEDAEEIHRIRECREGLWKPSSKIKIRSRNPVNREEQWEKIKAGEKEEREKRMAAKMEAEDEAHHSTS
ncbi:uncharacterized protein K452DRAFT_355500 [Aplosporella prunicola CBS 121167]|uniref:Uncharacterized protein n=1 Tax=Aplosporella prunicola CBS 121167 TaxID=1176127 RepID=A0A6A6BRD9_9PEZI|nr:uncharacterized protein K452DRAFT_355500 [Aplosporella prunicola CBS 121167]KAF2146023.1 hypothetical protein K452DRAFT_355500 [Aplosporella prunicola CBS 121167]